MVAHEFSGGGSWCVPRIQPGYAVCLAPYPDPLGLAVVDCDFGSKLATSTVEVILVVFCDWTFAEAAQDLSTATVTYPFVSHPELIRPPAVRTLNSSLDRFSYAWFRHRLDEGDATFGEPKESTAGNTNWFHVWAFLW
jgi:hypothetical protein